MPVPTPNKGESKQDFVSRCMGDKNMQEYDQDQRAGICYSQWDDAKGKSVTPPKTRDVVPNWTYLVRHGSTDLNGGGDSAERIRGHIDVPLTDEGREQARALGKDLKDKGISMLYSSDLSRAKETADLMSMEMGKIPVLTSSSLR